MELNVKKNDEQFGQKAERIHDNNNLSDKEDVEESNANATHSSL